MKAALLYEKDDLRIVDIPIPTVGPKDILMKVRAAKVCPTDIRKYRLGLKDHSVRSLPMNLCHEWTGDVVEVGAEVPNIKKGMRCLGLGMAGNAEYAKIDQHFFEANNFRLVELPDSIPYEVGTFILPLSENMHSILDQAQCKFGDTILIAGAGSMGLMQTNVAKWTGATVIVSDINESRLEVAKEFGADYVINPAKENPVEAVRKITGGSMADCAVSTLGNPVVIKQAIDVTRNSARIVIFGGAPPGTIMQFDPNDIHYTEKILVGSEGPGLPPNRHIERRAHAVQHILKKRIPLEKIMTIMPLMDIVKTYEMIEKQQIHTAVLIPQ
ncbi:MAG: hypothetical protein QG670_372 [Thermoproteota archaeon]|nr:hypothetical protein [Thermoproteota archaeon]